MVNTDNGRNFSDPRSGAEVRCIMPALRKRLLSAHTGNPGQDRISRVGSTSGSGVEDGVVRDVVPVEDVGLGGVLGVV